MIAEAAEQVQEQRAAPRVDILVGHVLGRPLDSGGADADEALFEVILADAFAFLDDLAGDIFVPDHAAAFRPIFLRDGTPAADIAWPGPETGMPEPDTGAAWDIDPVFAGRQEIGPASDLLQSAMGNRQGGAEHVGGREADILTGGDGDDVLIGAQGDDVLTGGAGADVFVFSQSATGRDRITDFDASTDRLYFGAETVFDLSEITVTADGDDTVLSWHRGRSELVLEDMSPDMLDADMFILAAA